MTCAGRNSSRRAILLKFVRIAHNSVLTPTAEEFGVREPANVLRII
jgi:hypothetical protein